MRARRQRGAVLALVLAIVIILMVGAAATYALSRLTTTREDTTGTMQSLERAQTALEQYAAAAQRLPCPANPTVDDGVEVTASATTCSFPEGTVPWKTIGMRRDDAFDTWGRKISYRVYTGNKGSLTQLRGISMVECDLIEPTAGATTATGLCVSNANPQLRSTSVARFLSGKGLSLSDNGVGRDAAYVLISHGATGLGAYTASGAQLPLPTGDERANLRDTGPFTIKPFSDVEVAASSGQHFDDFVAYRTLEDLVKRAGLGAHDWPEADPTVTTALTFDAATIYAATGTSPTTSTVLANTIDFGNVVATGMSTDTSTPAPALAFGTDLSPTSSGLGVGGNLFGGAFAFLNNMITNYGEEYLRLDLAQGARKFAVTLDDAALTAYGVYFKVQLRFYNVTRSGGSEVVTAVGTPIIKDRCVNGRQTASYTMTLPADFNRVEIVPVDSDYYAALSAFLVADIKGCTSAATTCKTSLALAAAPANATDCP